VQIKFSQYNFSRRTLAAGSAIDTIKGTYKAPPQHLSNGIFLSV
jgi:hypothetical protein